MSGFAIGGNSIARRIREPASVIKPTWIQRYSILKVIFQEVLHFLTNFLVQAVVLHETWYVMSIRASLDICTHA